MLQFHLMSAHILGKRHARWTRYEPSSNYVLPKQREDRKPERIRNFYDNGVTQADAMIHQLFQILGEKKYLDNSLVVITSDHGEALGEHGHDAHVNSVYQQVLRIPLIVISPGEKAVPFPEGWRRRRSISHRRS